MPDHYDRRPDNDGDHHADDDADDLADHFDFRACHDDLHAAAYLYVYRGIHHVDQ